MARSNGSPICRASDWGGQSSLAGQGMGHGSIASLIYDPTTNLNLFVIQSPPKPESTEGGRRVSVLKRQEGVPVNLG